MPDSLKHSQPRKVEVQPDDADRRLDNFLMSEFDGVPRSRIYRMIRGGEVRVNSRRAKAGHRLVSGDIVRLPPVREKVKPAGPKNTAWILDRIIYQDAHLLALDKPAGLAVHGGSGVSFGVIEMLRAAMPQERSLELVHRLDRDTSGCLLIARRRSCLRRLHAEFREGRVEKRYLAVLAGKLPQQRLVIDTPLLVTNRRDGERFVIADAAGKSARTIFSTQADYGDAILVDAQIETGRTHQIRVHAREAGCPVLGDERYGREAMGIAGRFGVERLCLHASALEFRHEPHEGSLLISAPLDDKMRALLSRLEQAAGRSRNRHSRRPKRRR
jgi:23S rRNA pseudouridine955/2504/2580 synthase